MSKVRVVIGIDVETDVGSWTPYYSGVEEGVPILLEALGQAGATATFFFTGDAALRYPGRAREVQRAGHEVGCHSLYHETVGDEIFPIPGVKPLLAEEVPLRLARATQAVQKAIRRRPVSFRAPRLWGSTAVVNALERLGYRADASYPLYRYRQRLLPYHPSRRNWLKEGESRVVEIPNFADVTLKSNDPYGRDLDQWPIFRTRGTESLMKSVHNFVRHVYGRQRKSRRPRIPVVCLYFHPWEFVPMRKRYHYGEGSVIPDCFIVKNCGPRALGEFKKFLAAVRKDFDADFLRAADVASLY